MLSGESYHIRGKGGTKFNAMWVLLVPIVTLLVATLAMATIVKVNVTVLKITVTQLLDVKMVCRHFHHQL